MYTNIRKIIRNFSQVFYKIIKSRYLIIEEKIDFIYDKFLKN